MRISYPIIQVHETLTKSQKFTESKWKGILNHAWKYSKENYDIQINMDGNKYISVTCDKGQKTKRNGDVKEFIIEVRDILEKDGKEFYSDWDDTESYGRYYDDESMEYDIIHNSFFTKEEIDKCTINY